MDTSETYIKMCEKAEEIQVLCEFGEGEFFAIGGQFAGPGQLFEYSYIEHSTLVWLPRQDQLQEIYGNEDPHIILALFNDEINLRFRRHDYYQQFTSLEQLWLAFVMKEKYNKVWNGDGWKVPS